MQKINNVGVSLPFALNVGKQLSERKYYGADYSHGEYIGGKLNEASVIIDSLITRFNLEAGWQLKGKPEEELLYEKSHLLEETRVLSLIGLFESNKFSEREIEVIKEYVNAGGRLLIMLMNPYGSDANRIADLFGVHFTDQTVEDKLHHEGKHKDHAIISTLVEHPINEGVENFCFGDNGGVTLEVRNPDAIVLAFSDKDADPPDAPVAVLTPFGMGWVIAIGGTTWIRDKYMRQFDNAKWFRNILTFLFSTPPP